MPLPLLDVATSVYEPGESEPNLKRPSDVVRAVCTTLLPVAVTVASATGLPLLKTVPVRYAFAAMLGTGATSASTMATSDSARTAREITMNI